MELPKLKSTDLKTLHELLMEVAKPWISSAVRPILIGWYRQPEDGEGRDSGRSYGMFRLQYGARTWRTGAWNHTRFDPTGMPEYKAELEQACRRLREGNWQVLACNFMSGMPFMAPTERDPGIEMCLRIEEGEITFHVRSEHSSKTVCMDVAEKGFRSVHRSRDVWFKAYGYDRPIPVVPPKRMFSSGDLSPLDRIGQEVKWWYDTPLQEGPDGQATLGSFLNVLQNRFAEVGEQVAIAYSRHRFNDAMGDDFWSAVYVDGHAWENGCYFRNSAALLAAAPRAINEAIGLLEQVNTCGVRQRFADYIGDPAIEPDTMVLSYDGRGLLIAFSSSVDDGGPVYRMDPETGLPSFIGLTPRLDWRFNDYCGHRQKVKVHTGDTNPIVDVMSLEDWVAHQSDGDKPYDEDFPILLHVEV